MVESQTSYISRLAEAHYVSVGSLIGKEIAPLLGKSYLLNSSNNGGSRFYENGIEINGLGKQAEDFTQALSSLTGVNTIKNLTLLPFHKVLPIRSVFRKGKAWCPLCLEEWKNNNLQIYEPLIWSFKDVKICGIHNFRLEMQCPHCKKEIPVLSRKARNGFCSFCGCWLGFTNVNVKEDISLEQLSWEHYVYINIANLIKMGNALTQNLSDSSVYMFIKSIIDEAGGTIAFSQYINAPNTTVRLWFKRKNKPSLYYLLRICFRLGINITEVFDSNQQCINVLPLDNEIYAKKESKTNVNTQKRKIDWCEIEAKLKAFVDNKFDSIPSIRELARNLGYDKRLLYKHYPDLCKKISEKHALLVELMKEKRIEQGSQKIYEAIVNLHNLGIYPSRRRIESLLSSNIILREKAYQTVWKETLANLGLLESKCN